MGNKECLCKQIKSTQPAFVLYILPIINEQLIYPYLACPERSEGFPTSIDDIFREQIPYISIFSGISETTGLVSEWLQHWGLEVACELDKRLLTKQFHEYSFDTCPKFSYKEFELIGLRRKYPETNVYHKATETNVYHKANSASPFYAAAVAIAVSCALSLLIIHLI